MCVNKTNVSAAWAEIAHTFQAACRPWLVFEQTLLETLAIIMRFWPIPDPGNDRFFCSRKLRHNQGLATDPKTEATNFKTEGETDFGARAMGA